MQYAGHEGFFLLIARISSFFVDIDAFVPLTDGWRASRCYA
jgi:hypothetical protein